MGPRSQPGIAEVEPNIKPTGVDGISPPDFSGFCLRPRLDMMLILHQWRLKMLSPHFVAPKQ